jgi:Response regulators consisting of a CheY-like receiver domain and a winged-helix DNA-binding domain
MRVLVVEDKVSMADALQRALATQGYAVDVAYDGERGQSLARNAALDVIILDIMLPRKDGLTVLKELRQQGIKTPAIILSARDSMAEIVHGLDMGADDYITKPFALDVLLARVRAAARRSIPVTRTQLQFEDLTLIPETLELQRGSRVTQLTRTEFAILEKLIRRPRAIVPREVLLEQAWGPDTEGTGASLYVFISSLRSKITQKGEKEMLHTVRGVGYSLKIEAC